MKDILKKAIFLIIKFWSYIYSPLLSKKISLLLSLFYTFWLSREFKSIGKNAHIAYPIYLKGGKYIEIGDGFASLERLRLECWDTFGDDKFTPNLTIGSNVIMNYNVHIGCIEKVSIGNNVLFASNIFITDHQHGYADKRDIGIAPMKRSLNSKGPVIIEDNVWIGENVAIMPRVTIGANSIIGANSVITKDVPVNSVVAGIPGKIIKML